MNREAVVSLIRQKISGIIYDKELGLDFAISDERMFTPDDHKDLYFVVKFGQGQVNYALADIPVTINCVSNTNEIDTLMDILWEFLEQNNYKTINGITLAFLSPQITNNFSEIFDGYRALCYVGGNIRIPKTETEEDTTYYYARTINKIKYGNNEIENFISCHINYSTQPDPQVFSGSDGYAKALNRQKVLSVVITDYINDKNSLVSAVKLRLNNTIDMNTTFTLGFYNDSIAIIPDSSWILTDVTIPQEIGAYPLISMTFTRA